MKENFDMLEIYIRPLWLILNFKLYGLGSMLVKLLKNYYIQPSHTLKFDNELNVISLNENIINQFSIQPALRKIC